jgi:siroheme synthase
VSDDHEPSGTRRRAGRDISVVVGVLSLIAAVVFSGIQVRDSAQSITQSRQSLELQ